MSSHPPKASLRSYSCLVIWHAVSAPTPCTETKTETKDKSREMEEQRHK